MRICLTEPTDWLGGQLTSSGVSAIDFGMCFICLACMLFVVAAAAAADDDDDDDDDGDDDGDDDDGGGGGFM